MCTKSCANLITPAETTRADLLRVHNEQKNEQVFEMSKKAHAVDFLTSKIYKVRHFCPSAQNTGRKQCKYTMGLRLNLIPFKSRCNAHGRQVLFWWSRMQRKNYIMLSKCVFTTPVIAFGMIKKNLFLELSGELWTTVLWWGVHIP